MKEYVTLHALLLCPSFLVSQMSPWSSLAPPSGSNHKKLLAINNVALAHVYLLEGLYLCGVLILETYTDLFLPLSFCLCVCTNSPCPLSSLYSLLSLICSRLLVDCCMSSIRHSARVGWPKVGVGGVTSPSDSDLDPVFRAHWWDCHVG